MSPYPRTVALLAVPGVQLLDVSGPLDVFAEANERTGRKVYDPVLVGTEPGHIRSSSGVRLIADSVLTDGWPRARLDTLLVAGRPGAADDRLEQEVLSRLKFASDRARRFGSVCSGAFFLAGAGLLNGRRVTTHWAVADRLQSKFPAVKVEPDAIYIADGPVRTAAGVTAGLDLALSMVEEDLGTELASAVASQLVMYFRRPGGQLQFSRKGEAAPVGRSALQEVQRWARANPAEDLTVAALAARMEISPRHFARLFRQEVGETPASWIEAARIEAARKLLETGIDPPKLVAAKCGFADANVLRRAFARQLGVTPAEYRRRHAVKGLR